MTTPCTIPFPSPAAAPIGTEFVSVANGHLSLSGERFVCWGVNCDWWAVGTPIVFAGGKGQLDPGLCATVGRQLDNLVRSGVRAIRVHGLDVGRACNIFCAGNGPQTATRQLDPLSLDAFCWFFAQCKARNLRIVLTLHYLRQLTAADQPAWACPSFVESQAQKTPGLMSPWFWFDAGLLQLQTEYATQLLRAPNAYTGVAIGDDPTLLAVILQNEHSLVKDGGPMSCPQLPVFQQLATAAEQAYCQAHSIAWRGQFTLNKVQYQQWLASVETQVLSAQAAAVRALTPALVIAGTYYGAAQHASLVGPAAAGDLIDCHFYSRYAPSDTNGFLDGQSPIDARSRFAAVLAGCGWGKPQVVTEWGPVGQFNPLARDADAERAHVVRAAVESLLAQDVDAAFLYSWGHAALTDGQFATYGVYDFRDDPVLLTGWQSHAAWFHDTSLRPPMGAAATSTTVAPTAGLYGTGTGPSYALFGPYNDPALYAIPPAQKVQMTL